MAKTRGEKEINVLIASIFPDNCFYNFLRLFIKIIALSLN